ncbi:unnamed protein product [Sphagnum balticum]
MSSRKAPFATLHDKTSYEPRREGTSAAAPWMKDQVSPNIGRATTIGSSYIASNSQTAPYATFHNQPLRRQAAEMRLDAPWEKGPEPPALRSTYIEPYYEDGDSGKQTPEEQKSWKQEQLLSNCLATPEQSGLPSLQTIPFGTAENIEQQKQDSDGTKDDAPWDKDQRQVHVTGPASQEYSKNMPYGTSENIEDQRQANVELGTPWDKDQQVPQSNRINTYTMDPIFCAASSHTAPFATFDNDIPPQPNRTTFHQAPWDRDEVHYNRVHQRNSSPHTPVTAPFATDCS